MVGSTIKHLRLQRGWRQKDVASILNISTPAYNHIETGVTDMNFSRLEQVAAVFGLTTIELLSYGRLPAGEVAESKLMIRLIRERDHEIFLLQQRMIELLEELKTLPVIVRPTPPKRTTK